MKEFQRGSSPAEILNLSIDNEQQYLLSYCSDYEISIFDMNRKVKGKSKWYTGGEQALTSMKVEATCLSAFFTSSNEIVVIDTRGTYQKYCIKEVEMSKIKIEGEGKIETIFGCENWKKNMIKGIIVIMIIISVQGICFTYSEEEEDIIGWDGNEYKRKEEVLKAIKRQEQKIKEKEKIKEREMKRINDENKKFETSSKQKRKNRNERRKLIRKLKESKIKLLNYQELIKNFN
ncbi:hypothetical protein EDI_070290 [Entamoeba dispar SAW760]|uniref:Uncharacterized protein n=1 Tax=Entamoeba dispar (strain ATCC PRA-260 / SAW760) TaxID=370354 RepID=B0EM79_ENTDS|nr:uncharacterized protein EDI_070290 [Entamoeba dispar SAW760]EDR24297.1 hypothetical protein EDI_070290 [Entamoeba dispar SAW760]|eukprot:EDR24297.1 hypothetical protein EDI_070290 [Entamoeba dispar SAW760]